MVIFTIRPASALVSLIRWRRHCGDAVRVSPLFEFELQHHGELMNSASSD
jgi:hypothetical protein